MTRRKRRRVRRITRLSKATDQNGYIDVRNEAGQLLFKYHPARQEIAIQRRGELTLVVLKGGGNG